MTNDERMALLRDAVLTHGSQAKVAKRLKYSSATVSQAMAGEYKGSLDTFLTRVEEVFGTSEVKCPVLGDILLPECVEERRTPFTTANPHRVRMFQVCRTCPNNTDARDDE
jgi:hypothetical protein